MPGLSGSAVDDDVPPPVSNSTERPDLQIVASRSLGDGSKAICDTSGGIPGIDPPNFSSDQATIDALIDWACRFDSNSPTNPCTLNGAGNSATLTALPSGGRQFCDLITSSSTFPEGDTIVVVRLRDFANNLGDPVEIVVRHE